MERVSLTGACCEIAGQRYLLSKSVWQLVRRVQDFGQRSSAERDSRSQRLAWGAIRRAAMQAGARLDDFLYRTVVLAPEQLTIGLRKAIVGGEKVVEVRPEFEGSPEGWLNGFDRVSRVLDRYDLATPQGVVQVVVTPEVKTVLEQIKRMPGRRVAGARAEAFVANPFAVLGETAARVIDAEQFEQSKVDAGLRLDHFTVYVQADERGHPAELGLVVEAGSGESAASLRVPFRDDTDVVKFITSVRGRIARELQVCPWGEFEFELLGDAEDQLRILEGALEVRQRPAPAWVLPATSSTSSQYSERIEGIGVEKPYRSAYIARKDDGEGWFPDNPSTLIGMPSDDGAGTPTPVPLSPNSWTRSGKEMRGERPAGGSLHGTVPGVDGPVPVDDVADGPQTFGRASRRRRPASSIQEIEQAEAAGTQVAADQAEHCLGRLPRAAYRAPERTSPKPQLPERAAGGTAAQAAPARRTRLAAAPVHAVAGALPRAPCWPMTWASARRCSCWRSLPGRASRRRSHRRRWWWRRWRCSRTGGTRCRRFFEPGTLKVLEVYGDTLAAMRLPPTEIDAQLRAEGLVKFLRPGWVGDADIVLTTYETLRDQEFSFAAQKWSVIVCDEAQKIKNPNALVTRAAKKQNARFRVACTGTPVENTLADLWCLFDFVQPGFLGALNEFGRQYRRPIEARTDEERQRVEELRGAHCAADSATAEEGRGQGLAAENPEHGLQAAAAVRCAALPCTRQAIGQFSRRQEPGAVTPFKNALGPAALPAGGVHGSADRTDSPASRPKPWRSIAQKSPKLDWLLMPLREIEQRDEKALIFCEFRDMQRMLRHYIADVVRVLGRHHQRRHERRLAQFGQSAEEDRRVPTRARIRGDHPVAAGRGLRREHPGGQSRHPLTRGPGTRPRKTRRPIAPIASGRRKMSPSIARSYGHRISRRSTSSWTSCWSASARWRMTC